MRPATPSKFVLRRAPSNNTNRPPKAGRRPPHHCSDDRRRWHEALFSTHPNTPQCGT